jgi:hypothetical protein
MAMRGAADVGYSDKCITGSKNEVKGFLKRSIAQLCRDNSNVTKMYIGIASGEDAITAMHKRYDEYKFDEGLNEMIALYKTSSQDNVCEVEGVMAEFFEKHHCNINRAVGGAGRESAGPNYFLYVGIRRWG